jgi:hypothetical protein
MEYGNSGKNASGKYNYYCKVGKTMIQWSMKKKF